jgi:D-serine deaminase-like pyridoxal phosphate-dependent protein
MEDELSMRVADLETPALLIDLDAMESNLSRVSDFYRLGLVRARPHFKNHCVLSLAERQIAGGAIGITVARVRHAEALVELGVSSILIANEIVDDSSLRRLIDLSHRAEIILSVDDAENIARIAHLAGDAKSNVNVVIDLEVGLGRCGAPPNQALTLARLARDAGLRVRGLMGYEGHLQKLPDTDETRRLRSGVAELLNATRTLLEQDGIPVDIVTLGGTGTYKAYLEFPAITEIQVGSYLLMDTLYKPFAPDFELGLTVLTRVISSRAADHIVLDAGLKAISSERGMPAVKNLSGLRVAALHAEHAVLAIEDPNLRVRTNDLLELWVHYSDATVHLHRTMYGVRRGAVEEAFPIEY